MTKNKHESWYRVNAAYSSFLNNQDDYAFELYVEKILEYLSKKGTFLDIGCGTGNALDMLRKRGVSNSRIKGVEVSKTSLLSCKSKGLHCKLYDGKKLPFKAKTFDIVGSINVLEHTDNPKKFLDEKFRLVKKGGYIIVICPNFLSITNNYHRNTRGVLRKIVNLFKIIVKSTLKRSMFEKMQTTQNEIFQPDDDAVNETNPIDTINWSKTKKLTLKFWSSQQRTSSAGSILDKGFLRLLLGSCFLIFQKN